MRRVGPHLFGERRVATSKLGLGSGRWELEKFFGNRCLQFASEAIH
jgi:hypothetical protein